MIIQSVELVTPANAMAYEDKFYRAHLDTGEALDLFQQRWDVRLPPESLIGLTVEEAERKRNTKMQAATYGASRFLSLVPEYLA